MSELQSALSRRVWIQNEGFRNMDLGELYGKESRDALVSAIKADIPGTWGILCNGTDDEFSELLNNFDEVGGIFNEDRVMCEVMRIGRQRLENTLNKEEFMANLRVGFGILFDQFWNET